MAPPPPSPSVNFIMSIVIMTVIATIIIVIVIIIITFMNMIMLIITIIITIINNTTSVIIIIAIHPHIRHPHRPRNPQHNFHPPDKQYVHVWVGNGAGGGPLGGATCVPRGRWLWALRVGEGVAGALVRLDRRIARVGGDPGRALRPVGVALVRNTRRRIEAERTPDGAPFAPLHPRTLARKRGLGILRELGVKGGMFASLTSQVEGNRLRVGTYKPYAATHQFGDARRNIPARPFLGVSAEDLRDIRETIEGHIRRVTGA
jgi:phage virion morphogenesis protein